MLLFLERGVWQCDSMCVPACIFYMHAANVSCVVCCVSEGIFDWKASVFCYATCCAALSSWLFVWEFEHVYVSFLYFSPSVLISLLCFADTGRSSSHKVSVWSMPSYVCLAACLPFHPSIFVYFRVSTVSLHLQCICLLVSCSWALNNLSFVFEQLQHQKTTLHEWSEP